MGRVKVERPGAGGSHKVYTIDDCTIHYGGRIEPWFSFPPGVTWGDIKQLTVVGTKAHIKQTNGSVYLVNGSLILESSPGKSDTLLQLNNEYGQPITFISITV